MLSILRMVLIICPTLLCWPCRAPAAAPPPVAWTRPLWPGTDWLPRPGGTSPRRHDSPAPPCREGWTHSETGHSHSRWRKTFSIHTRVYKDQKKSELTIYLWARRTLTTSNWPARELMWSAVFPFLVAASILAPLASRSWTISTWPSLLARCRAFKPFWKWRIFLWTHNFLRFPNLLHCRCWCRFHSWDTPRPSQSFHPSLLLGRRRCRQTKNKKNCIKHKKNAISVIGA